MSQEWIEYQAGVQSSKPTTGEAVIVYSPIEGMGVAARYSRFGVREFAWIYKRVNDSAVVRNPTHWMPLPDPPTSDEG